MDEVTFVHDIMIVLLVLTFAMAIFSAVIVNQSAPMNENLTQTVNDLNYTMRSIKNSGLGLSIALSANCTVAATDTNSTFSRPGCFVGEKSGDWLWVFEAFVNLIYRLIYFICSLVAMVLIDIVALASIVFVIIPELLRGAATGALGDLMGYFFPVAIIILIFYFLYLFRNIIGQMLGVLQAVKP